MKKILLFSILIIFVVASLVSFSSAKEISGNCGTQLNYTLDTEGTLTVSGSGNMTEWGSYTSVPWNSEHYKIKRIVISDGVTSIGNYAFLNCIYATSVSIPKSVTDIGHSAFYNCNALTSVSLPPSLTRIGNWAFAGCGSLTNITIPASVMKIGYCAFFGCDSLMRITVNNSNNYYSSDTRGALFTKDKKTLIQYPAGNINTSYYISQSVTKIESYAFSGNKSLSIITIPDTITSVSQKSFYNTAYYSNTANRDENGVLYIGKHLIDAPSSLSGDYTVRENTVTITSGAFEKCHSLNSVTIPDTVAVIEASALNSCTRIIVSENNPYYSSDENGVLFNKDKTALIKYPSKSTNTSYRIPNCITDIGNFAFSGCKNLESISFEQGSRLKSIGNGAFYECHALEELNIPAGAIEIGAYAFDSCLSLKSINIHDSVMSIGDYAFFSCIALTVKGYEDSASQAYALNNGLSFITLTPVSGDLKGDGTADISDVITALQLLASDDFSSLTKSQTVSADVNVDGTIDISDIIRMLQNLASI